MRLLIQPAARASALRRCFTLLLTASFTVTLTATLTTLLAASLCSRVAAAQSTGAIGLLWSGQGEWHHENGKDLAAGDAVSPGELLQPSAATGAHQVIVLLPDGQRLLFQCFSSKDCARGFRVPQLNAKPSAFAIDMLDRIRLAQASGRLPQAPPTPPRTVPATLDEMVAKLTPQKQILLTGLASTIAAGRYTYDLAEMSGSGSPAEGMSQRHLPLEKTSDPALLPLPGPGLYEVRIADSFNTQRIRILVLATDNGDAAPTANLAQAKQTLREWNEIGGGWPVHPLLRFYLLSLAEKPIGHR
jgi:hypothetical protein